MMKNKVELLFLLLMITTQTQQSESANCILDRYNRSGVKRVELSFEGHDEVSCNLSVNATDSIYKYMEDIFEILYTSCLLHQGRILLTTTTTEADECVNKIVEHIVTITSTHTQEVYSQTTVSICPISTISLSEDTHLETHMASTALSKDTHLVTSTTNTVYSTRSSDSTNTPTTKTILSNVAQIGILAASGVLMCLPISALVVVTFCWIRTRRTLKENRNEVRFYHSAQDSIPSRRKNISEPAPLSLSSNPAYAAWKPLKKNIAHEDTTMTTVTTSDPRGKESTNTQELAYEIVPLASCQSASTNAHALKK